MKTKLLIRWPSKHTHTYLHTTLLAVEFSYFSALIEIPLSSGTATASFRQPRKQEKSAAAATKFIGNRHRQGGKKNKTLTQYPAYGHNFYAASSEKNK